MFFFFLLLCSVMIPTWHQGSLLILTSIKVQVQNNNTTSLIHYIKTLHSKNQAGNKSFYNCDLQIFIRCCFHHTRLSGCLIMIMQSEKGRKRS